MLLHAPTVGPKRRLSDKELMLLLRLSNSRWEPENYIFTNFQVMQVLLTQRLHLESH